MFNVLYSKSFLPIAYMMLCTRNIKQIVCQKDYIDTMGKGIFFSDIYQFNCTSGGDFCKQLAIRL